MAMHGAKYGWERNVKVSRGFFSFFFIDKPVCILVNWKRPTQKVAMQRDNQFKKEYVVMRVCGFLRIKSHRMKDER